MRGRHIRVLQGHLIGKIRVRTARHRGSWEEEIIPVTRLAGKRPPREGGAGAAHSRAPSERRPRGPGQARALLRDPWDRQKEADAGEPGGGQHFQTEDSARLSPLMSPNRGRPERAGPAPLRPSPAGPRHPAPLPGMLAAHVRSQLRGDTAAATVFTAVSPGPAGT